MTVEIDGVLKEWGDRLFYTPIRPRGAKRTITRTTVAASAHPKPRTPTRTRHQLTETIRKTPEVMVKISGGGKGMRQIGAHLDYISRNGKVTLENDAGEHVDGRAAVNDLKDEWAHGLYGIPMDSRRREAFNIVLSMPPGTNRDAVTQAARRFAQSEFSTNHHYVFAAHDDEKHPHVHLCVQAQGIDGTRLNPRKADLQRWREHFAERLREQGVRANATPRTARGVSKRSKRQPAIHRASRVSREALPLTSTQAPQRTQDNFSASQRAALTAYRQIAAGLARSTNNEDRRLALGIVEFVRQMPALRDRNPLRRAETHQLPSRLSSAQPVKTATADLFHQPTTRNTSMNIIKALVICVVAGWMLIKASGAHAQIPVTDGASIATDVMNHIESIAKYVEQISQMKAQLDQTKRQYDALTGSRNLGAILNDPRYREYLPNDWQTVYDAVRTGGYAGLSGTAQTIYDTTRKFDGCAHIPADDERIVCQARAVKSAQDKAFATEAYERAQQRLSQIEQLMNRINGTEDPKAIAELQGRITSEQAMIQNEATKLQMFQIIAQAEDAVQKRQAHELQMRDAARRGTLGVAPMHFSLGRE